MPYRKFTYVPADAACLVASDGSAELELGTSASSTSSVLHAMPAFATSDEVSMQYTMIGAGSHLILIHGWSGSQAYFQCNVDELSQRFTVITYDQRCHGDSGKVAYGLHVARLAADLHELMDHLQLTCVSLLGTSMVCCLDSSLACVKHQSERVLPHCSCDCVFVACDERHAAHTQCAFCIVAWLSNCNVCCVICIALMIRRMAGPALHDIMSECLLAVCW
jgi:hypothetical protein